MPSDADPEQHDLEHQLRAFGATLEHATREPIARGRAVPLHAPNREVRRWAILGAAACVAALVVGLLAFGRGEQPESGTADAPAPTASTTATSATASTPAPAATTTAPDSIAGPDPAFDPEQHVPDDPLGLVADGWVLNERNVQAFDAHAEGSTCEALLILAGLDDQTTVYEGYTNPDRSGFDLDVTYLSASTASVVSAGLSAYAECPEITELGLVTAVASSDGVSGFRVGDEFALVAVAPGSVAEVPLVIVLELESMGVTDELIDELVRRSVAFLAGGRAPTVDSRPITDDERAALNGDAAGLICDAFGAGSSEWDYGPIDGSEPTGRVAADAFRDALDQVRDNVLREGGDAPPIDGWTELVIDATSSVFVLEIDGVWQGRINVAGDPAAGVWRHNSADFCQSVFIPDGVTPPTQPPATTFAPPLPQPPMTPAP
jgi:hypothetical protein